MAPRMRGLLEVIVADPDGNVLPYAAVTLRSVNDARQRGTFRAAAAKARGGVVCNCDDRPVGDA